MILTIIITSATEAVVRELVWKIQAWMGLKSWAPDLCEASAVLYQLSYQAK